MNIKFIKWVLIGLLGLTLPITLLLVAMLLHPFNPMQQSFISKLEIKNNSDNLINVTPIGTTGNNSKHVLQQYARRFPAFDSPKETDIPVPPNTTTTIFIHNDDICLSELVYSDHEGNYRQTPVGRNVTGCDSIRPKDAAFIFNSLSELEKVDPESVTLIKTHNPKNMPWWLWMGALPVPIFLIMIFYRRHLFVPPTTKPDSNWDKWPKICFDCKRGYDNSWSVCLTCGKQLVDKK